MARIRRFLTLAVAAALVAASIPLLLLTPVFAAPAAAGSDVSGLEDAERTVAQLHNQARAHAGVAPLKVHVEIVEDGRDWSREMATRGALMHQTTSNGYRSYSDETCADVATGGGWRSCGENVARGASSAKSVHDAWMGSPAHRANILDPKFDFVGIGVWMGADGSYWWTARFLGGPASTTPDSIAHPQDGGSGGAQAASRRSGADTYDPDGPEGTIYRLYRAYFLRQPDASGYDFWNREYQSGRPLNDISDEFSRSAEFRSRYGDVGMREYVRLVYENVLGRQPDSAGYDYWVGQMQRGMPRGHVMIFFSDSDEFRAKTANGRPPG